MMPIYSIVFLGLLACAQSKSLEHLRGEHLAGSRAEHAAHESSLADAVDSSRAGLQEVAAVLAKTREGQLSANEVHALSEELSRRGLPIGLLNPLIGTYRPRYPSPLYRPPLYLPGFKSDESHVERLAASHVSSLDPLHSNRAEDLVHLLVSQRDGSLEHTAAVLKSRADSIKAIEALHEAASRASSPAAEQLEHLAETLSRASALEAAKELIQPAHARNAQAEHIAAVLERANSLKALQELHESSRGGIQAALEQAALEHAAHSLNY